MSKNKPVVLIPSNIFENNGLPGHFVRDTYIQALLDVADCLPLIMPVTNGKYDVESITDRIDGILLTGSPSNVCPKHYGAERIFDEKLLDLSRDATTLPLIRRAIERDMPLIAICRGFQELNVAMGGSLHQKIQELPGKHDHREPQSTNLKIVYETAAHKVHSEKGGMFEKMGLPATFDVNSLHQQGVDRLGDGLFVEAVSDDGIIEAVSIPGKRFILGVQWHPEGNFESNPTSRKIFEAYGAAVHGAEGNGTLCSLKSGT